MATGSPSAHWENARPFSELDDDRVFRRPPAHRLTGSRRPWGITVVVLFLLVVIVVVVVLRAVVPLSHGSSGHRAVGLVAAGTIWKLGPRAYQAVRFTTSMNGTLSGNFTTNQHPVDMLLMVPPEFYLFSNNTSHPISVNSTDGVITGSFGWSVRPAGIYFLVAWNYDSSHTAKIDWVTSVQWFHYPAKAALNTGIAGASEAIRLPRAQLRTG